MNKVLSLLLVVAVVIGVVPHAQSIGAPNPPPGVAARNWVPMGDAAGFVITDKRADWQSNSPSAASVAKGYFMVRRESTWLRIDSAPEFKPVPTAGSDQAVSPNWK